MGDNVSKQIANSPVGESSDERSVERDSITSRRQSRTRARIVQAVSLLGLVVILLLLWHFLGSKSDKASNRPRGEVVPVEVVTATQIDVPIQIKNIGNVEAFSTIAVRSQVEGTLQRIHFTPGQEVKTGDLLFTIDPRQLQAMLSQAEANLAKSMAAVSQGRDVVARDQATATNSQIIAKRDAQLIESGVISREEYDNAVSKMRADEATVRADQASVATLEAAAKAERANVNNATVQLGYTSIRAPISGKTGNLVTTAGNLIRANDTTPMITITQASPIYVTFAVPEQDLLRIRQYASSNDFKTAVVVPGDEGNPAQGKLSLVDNTIDTTTGTIRLKAIFDNANRELFPGLFVNVVLTLGLQHDATVVPSQAVQLGQDNTFVYIVKPDMTAEVRTVKTGASVNNMTVIEEGVKPGEQVVTDGQLRLVPGATVQTKSAQPGGGGNRKGENTNPNPAAGNGVAGGTGGEKPAPNGIPGAANQNGRSKGGP